MPRAATFTIGLIGMALSSPAMAMPNAFWIFGFHVPGRPGPKSDVVLKGDPRIERAAGTPSKDLPVAVLAKAS